MIPKQRKLSDGQQLVVDVMGTKRMTLPGITTAHKGVTKSAVQSEPAKVRAIVRRLVKLGECICYGKPPIYYIPTSVIEQPKQLPLIDVPVQGKEHDVE